MPNKVFIIAEAGVNHNGSLSVAKKLASAAAYAGADAVKFQTFKAEALASKCAPKAGYQKKAAGKNQLQMLKSLELGFDGQKKLFNYCKKRKIMFMSSAFDMESLGFILELGVTILKIPSGEIANLPYLRKAGASGKKIILSTGMANMSEVKEAFNVLLRSGADKKHISLLHCTTQYPAPPCDVNLKAMTAMKNVFDVSVGYSDHTEGIEIPVAAVAMGAEIIEKHFTLDNKMRGPDHKASLNPQDFKRMVCAIRKVESALGGGIKKPAPSELKNRDVVRKSITAKVFIKKGEKFTEKNITAKRPGGGVSPMRWDYILGKAAVRDFKADEQIKV
ncbi:MAG: N-acetylneuraminate synthase [Elusimicrobia bacterium]|nr:N-acetylneuraminate synthase [Elusimicrobiota bacterium]